jgi:hypothetical protein
MKTGICLKERAKERLVHRELPLAKDFDEYLRIRSSCWIIETESIFVIVQWA